MLKPVKMTHAQRLAWLKLEGWETAIGPGSLRGICHYDYPGRLMVIANTLGARSSFSHAVFYRTDDVQRKHFELSKEHTALFMRRVQRLKGEDQ